MELIGYLILRLLLLTLLFAIGVVLLTYSIFWYERANSSPELINQRFSCSNLLLTLCLIAPEVFFNFITLVMIPLGLSQGKKFPQQKSSVPILLIHGLFVNHSCWFWLKWQLKRQGIENTVTLKLSSWHNEEALTEQLAKRVDELRHQLGVDKIAIVGHSMGGIIARNYIQLRGGAEKVERLVCLGTPHQGSRLACFTFAPLGKILMPGSDFLKRLNNAAPPEQVKTYNVFTQKDNMIIPNESCRLPWGETIELDNMGHTSLLYRHRAIKAVISCLPQKNDND
jgi:triacylglycerol esterase/lipase EstA (alpha/beta hydrolase family)